MDYSKIYIELMERANNRVIDGYSEKHHIVPRCMGGDNKPRNIAVLTPEEHYLAHLLLVKIYPTNTKLVFAASMMTGNGHNNQARNNKSYAWLRIKAQIASKNRVFTEATRKKISDARKGMVLSEATRKKMSDSRKGDKHHNFGKNISEETRKKMSDANKGRVFTEEAKNKMSDVKKGDKHHYFGKKHSEETRKKMSESHKRRKLND